MTYHIAVIGPNGRYASFDPTTHILAFDRDAVAGSWEQFTAKPSTDPARWVLESVSAPGWIWGVDVTQFGSNELSKLFYLTDRAPGNYEQFFLGTTPNGLLLAMIEYLTQGVTTKPYASPNLTLVQL